MVYRGRREGGRTHTIFPFFLLPPRLSLGEFLAPLAFSLAVRTPFCLHSYGSKRVYVPTWEGGRQMFVLALYARRRRKKRPNLYVVCVLRAPYTPSRRRTNRRTEKGARSSSRHRRRRRRRRRGGSDRDGRPTRLVCLPTKKAFVRRRWKKIRPPPPPPFPPPFPLSPLRSDDKSLPSEKSTYVCTARAEGVVVWHLQRSSHDPTE